MVTIFGGVEHYDGLVKRLVAESVWMLIFGTGMGASQIIQPPARPPHYIEIKVPAEASSEGVFIRYILAGEELGGWIQPRAGVSSYIIATTRGDRAASGIKAVLYAPGCAIQTLDMPLTGSTNAEYTYRCEPLKNVWIAGRLIERDRLAGREVQVRAKYIARWAQGFLGLSADVALSIPIGDVAYPDADGLFRVPVPDLSQDPLAGRPDHPGEVQIWAEDKSSDEKVAQLIPTGPQAIRTRLGGLRVQREYPQEIVFAPCGLNAPLVLIHRDAEGFAHRPPGRDPCESR